MKTVANATYIKGIKLENIRAFKNLEIDLSSPNRVKMSSVIIGRNGTCKSTLLRCIALGLCKRPDASVLLSEFGGRLVSENAEFGSIELEFTNSSGTKTGGIRLGLKHEDRMNHLIHYLIEPLEKTDFFACGYGPLRGNTGNSKFRDYRVSDSVSTLFDYQRGLVDIELNETFPELQIFATTHCPFTVLGAKSQSLIALHRHNDQVQMAEVPSLTGYSSDDALLDEALFGTDPYPQSTRLKIDRHRTLKTIPAKTRSSKQKGEIRNLELELNPEKLPSLREDKIINKLHKIADLLEKEKH